MMTTLTSLVATKRITLRTGSEPARQVHSWLDRSTILRDVRFRSDRYQIAELRPRTKRATFRLMHRNMTAARAYRETARRSLRNPTMCLDQAAAKGSIVLAVFRFLRQPNRPSAPRPAAKSGKAAGRGVAEADVS
jgi:hypothetical protein